jgi:hypothetical protein
MLSSRRKLVYKMDFGNLVTAPATFRASNCEMPAGVVDTVSIVLKCPIAAGAEDLANCVCYSNDDGCGGIGGDIVGNVPLDATSAYYSVIMPYSSSTVTGSYKVTVSDAAAPSSVGVV